MQYKKTIKYYTRNQNSPSLSVFMIVRKTDEGEFFPIKVDGEEKLLTIPEISNLKGSYRVIIKCGILRDGRDGFVWSLSAQEIFLDTTVTVPNETGFKFSSIF